MPELPEVESIRRVLLPDIQKRRIEKIISVSPHLFAYPKNEDIASFLCGQIFSDIQRKGKYLLFIFESGDRLIVHLKMTGRLLILPFEEEEKHTHLLFKLSNGSFFKFIDTRKLGRMWYIKKGCRYSLLGIEKLGPEPFDDALCGDYLFEKLNASKRPIKTALMDQSVVSGIGNIYSDEVLNASGILPSRRCCDIQAKEYDKLAYNIRYVLGFFLEKNLITKEEYVKTRAKEYKNTPYIKVYGHDGLPCPVCGSILKKTVISGRSSCFCPSCQK